ncbi:MAG: hypothetical protein WBL87_05405 [Methanothrix sp.]
MHKDVKLKALLASFGFSEDELYRISDELDTYKSIPGITIGRYIDYIIGNINQDHRSAFLKGIIAGLAIKKADDELYGHCSEGMAWGISREDSLGCNRWINLYKWND